jgi:hypothetical protein
MTKIENTDRRTVLKGAVAGALGLSGTLPAAAADHADSELINLCREHDRLRGEVEKYEALYLSGFDAASDPLETSVEAKDLIENKIASLPALTLAGLQARARVLEYILEEQHQDSDEFEHQMMRSMIRDIAAMSPKASA